MSAGGISILILSEDGPSSVPVFNALVKKMLRLAGGDMVDVDRVPLEHLRETRVGLQAIVTGNHWKNKRTDPDMHKLKVELRQQLATQVVAAGGYVLFHFDGDQPFSNTTTCENLQKFETEIVAGVRAVLTGKPARRKPLTPEEVERVMARLVPLVPYYSIESWLYQNTDTAVAIAKERYQGQDIHWFESWRSKRAELDDVVDPKSKTALHAKHNQELAEGHFPAQEVFDANASFARAVDDIRKSGLCALLPIYPHHKTA